VMRALEKKPEDRYQSAREFTDDIQRFLQNSGAKMRSHHQLARYLRDLYSPEAEAQITEDGLRQARIFAEGDEDSRREDSEVLDFDRVSADGPGAALARALRAAGSPLDVDARGDGESPSAEKFPIKDSTAPVVTDNGQVAASRAAPVPVSPADSGSADVAAPASRSGPRQTPLVVRVSRPQKAAADEDKVPRSLPIGAILLVIVLLAAAAAGLVLLVRS
jgi:hypothetical protein